MCAVIHTVKGSKILNTHALCLKNIRIVPTAVQNMFNSVSAFMGTEPRHLMRESDRGCPCFCLAFSSSDHQRESITFMSIH